MRMDQMFTSFVSACLAMLALVIALIFFDQSPTESSKELVKETSTEFTDTVREKGYIDPRDYEAYMSTLENLGMGVSVSMEYYKKRYHPLYVDDNNFATFTDQFDVLYEGFFDSDILPVLYPNTNVPISDPSRRYRLNIGDMFKVYVDIKPSLGERILAKVFSSTANSTIETFGGLVRDEP